MPACQKITPMLKQAAGVANLCTGCLLSILPTIHRKRVRVPDALGSRMGDTVAECKCVLFCLGSCSVCQTSWLPASHAVSMKERQQYIMLACEALCALRYIMPRQ